MNYQWWDGFSDTRFGYGAMLDGFLLGAPNTVVFDRKASVHVHMGVPFSLKGWFHNQHRVLFSMWETTELPNSFRRYLPLYDQVIVPNVDDKHVFSRHHDRVDVVPLGVDVGVYQPMNVPRLPRFQFRAGGSLWGRKGLDVVVEAFNRLRLPDAELRIKAAPHARDVPTGFLGDNIVLDRQWMSETDKKRWFAEADCFIAVSRGEGFGLMPLQTIAMGVPTIVSLTTGQKQFAHLATGTVQCSKKQSNTVGLWDEPNVDQLCHEMVHHYENRDQVRKVALLNSGRVAEFSWQEAARKLVETVPVGDLLVTDLFVEATTRLRVQAQRNIDATIGEHKVRRRAGEVFEVTDGVYQVLYDSKAVKMVGDGS